MANTNTTANTTKAPKVDDKAAYAALSALSGKLGEAKKQAKAEREAAKAAKKAAECEALLGILANGTPKAKSSTWGPRYALRKAVQAVKVGATADQLRACKALQEVAPWGELVEPVTAFCQAKLVDAGVVLAGTNALATPAAAPEPAQEAPKAKASPKATPKPASARKPRQASARGKGKKAA